MHDPNERVTLDADTFTDDQRDGIACVRCGSAFAPGVASVPVGIVDGGQVFACKPCACPVQPDQDADTAAVALPETDRRTARVWGHVAARNRLPVTVCPWRGNSGRERALRFAWTRAYAQARPDQCDQALADDEPGVWSVVWDAHVHGRDAAAAGEPLSLRVCPYPMGAETAVGQAQFRAWCDGYDSVRPFPIDFGD
ncbi:hypothetical protein [Actinomadura macra]|uniref:hypothetical protein n=1 Tax=Actinomadura macra TaxID=46164 RepID=UPI00082B6A60|nr:hypothetical protein [Actinomadura macra]